MGKKKHEEHENHERWLVSYADFMTLLFAFFTVLWATSKSDQEKLEAVVDGIAAALEGGNFALMGEGTPTPAEPSAIPDPHVTLSAEAAPILRTLRMNLEGSLSDNVVQIGIYNQTLMITLKERLLFKPGSADLHPSGFDALTQLAEALRGERITLSVIGHADGTPVSGPPYDDNWGLASARSVETVRFLARRGVPIERLNASATITGSTNPEARAVTFFLRSDHGEPTAGVLDKLYPDPEAVPRPGEVDGEFGGSAGAEPVPATAAEAARAAGEGFPPIVPERGAPGHGASGHEAPDAHGGH